MMEAIENGDTAAEKIWLKSLKDLGPGDLFFTNILDPEAVILGGGIAKLATGFSCHCAISSTRCSGKRMTTKSSFYPRSWATSPAPTEPLPTVNA
ncbi:MAG: hypothetical protein Ct9H300mP32_5100 [Verrucomicrobiota bacterium]|nr:MAG: hypothetical protein Ct9H300mP32_5100 [Verrucomicrobiota bacterium]